VKPIAGLKYHKAGFEKNGAGSRFESQDGDRDNDVIAQFSAGGSIQRFNHHPIGHFSVIAGEFINHNSLMINTRKHQELTRGRL